MYRSHVSRCRRYNNNITYIPAVRCRGNPMPIYIIYQYRDIILLSEGSWTDGARFVYADDFVAACTRSQSAGISRACRFLFGGEKFFRGRRWIEVAAVRRWRYAGRVPENASSGVNPPPLRRRAEIKSTHTHSWIYV